MMNKKAKNIPPKDGRPPQKKLNLKTLKRLFSYLADFKLQLLVVFICITFNSGANVLSSLFLGTLIDDYIAPMLLVQNPAFTGLLKAIITMAVIYLIGVVSALIYNRTMAYIAQGTLKNVRDKMFFHMQTLPIRYFDKNTHGNIMSHYTNDTDTLRQMISQSIPQLFSSVITIISVLFAMISLSIPLTFLVILFVFVMMRFVGKVAGKSGKYFIEHQKTLGDLNGYIEEMINGQKVVKVFCYEERAKEKFNEKK